MKSSRALPNVGNHGSAGPITRTQSAARDADIALSGALKALRLAAEKLERARQADPSATEARVHVRRALKEAEAAALICRALGAGKG